MRTRKEHEPEDELHHRLDCTPILVVSLTEQRSGRTNSEWEGYVGLKEQRFKDIRPVPPSSTCAEKSGQEPTNDSKANMGPDAEAILLMEAVCR